MQLDAYVQPVCFAFPMSLGRMSAIFLIGQIIYRSFRIPSVGGSPIPVDKKSTKALDDSSILDHLLQEIPNKFPVSVSCAFGHFFAHQAGRPKTLLFSLLLSFIEKKGLQTVTVTKGSISLRADEADRKYNRKQETPLSREEE